jgi:hypothetical protein
MLQLKILGVFDVHLDVHCRSKRINRVYREFDNETGMADWRIFFRK